MSVAPRRDRHRYSVLPGIDGRTRSAKAYRSLFAAFEREVGHELSAFDRSLLHSAVTLTFKAAGMQMAVVRGEAVDADDLIRLSSEARRIIDSLKVRSAKRNAQGDDDELDRYLAGKAAAIA